jgi:hypothetical protein
MNSRWHIPIVALLAVAVFGGTFLAGRDLRHLTPPPRLTFGGLPVSGSLADAISTGFSDCFQLNASEMRCRRHGVYFQGQGPYEAAINVAGGDGRGGFNQLIIWHDRDQYAVYAIGDALEENGWSYCLTYSNGHGDQVIYRRPGARFRVSMDMTYYSKRRVRFIPDWNTRERECSPPSVGRPGRSPGSLT